MELPEALVDDRLPANVHTAAERLAALLFTTVAQFRNLLVFS
jgi:hypothetical protein